MLFEHRQEYTIHINKIASIVTQIFYPFEDERLHASIKGDIIFTLKNFCNEYNELTEDKFVEAMVGL